MNKQDLQDFLEYMKEINSRQRHERSVADEESESEEAKNKIAPPEGKARESH